MKGKTMLVMLLALVLVLVPLLGACSGEEEAKPETKPVATEEAKPETKPVATEEAKPETKPEPKPEAKPEVEKVLKVGEVSVLSTPAAAILAPGTFAMQDYWKYVNEELGGINGVQIEFIWNDCEYSVPKAVANYESLKGQGAIMLCCGWSSAGMALKDTYAKDKMPVVQRSAAGVMYWPPGWIYGHVPTYADLTAGAGDWIMQNWKEERAPKVGILCEETYGKTIFLGGTQHMEELGIEIVGTEYATNRTTDVTTQLSRLAKLKPDFIVSNTLAGGAGPAMVRDRYKLGIEVPFITTYGLMGPWMLEQVGAEQLEGTIFVTSYASTMMPPGEKDPPGVALAKKLFFDNGRDKEIAKGLTQEYLWGITSAIIAHEAIRMTLEKVPFEEVDGEAIKVNGLDQMRNFDPQGIVGKISYPADCRIGNRELIAYESKGGYETLISDWYPFTPIDNTKFMEE